MAATAKASVSRPAADLAYLCRALKAPNLAAVVARLAERARADGWTHEEFRTACLEREVAARQSHGGEARIRSARFPARKTLEEFNFDHQRNLKRDVIAPLGALDFVEARDNVVFLGPVGLGGHCVSFHRVVSNSPGAAAFTLIRKPFRRPRLTWTASRSPRWTLCNTVWRATPRTLAA